MSVFNDMSTLKKISTTALDYLEFILTIHMIIDNNNVLYQTRRLVRGIFGQIFGTTFREIKAKFKI